LSSFACAFPLNQTRRAGKLRGCETEFFAAGFPVPRVLRGDGARGFHQRPELCAAGGLGARERVQKFLARAKRNYPDEQIFAAGFRRGFGAGGNQRRECAAVVSGGEGQGRRAHRAI